MNISTISELRRQGRAWDWIAIQIQDERNEAVRQLNAERNETSKLREELGALQSKPVRCTTPTLLDILECVPSNALSEDIGWLQIAAGECPVDDAPTVLRVVAGFICKEIDKARPHVFDHFGDQPGRRCIRCDQREAFASDQCAG